MCDVIFEEVLVVFMFGGLVFFRFLIEFIVRMCFVNFDGRVVLKVSMVIGFYNLFFEGFVEEYCVLIVGGI